MPTNKETKVQLKGSTSMTRLLPILQGALVEMRMYPAMKTQTGFQSFLFLRLNVNNKLSTCAYYGIKT